MADMLTELDRAIRATRIKDGAGDLLHITVDTLKLLLADVWEDGYRTHRGKISEVAARFHNPYRQENEA